MVRQMPDSSDWRAATIEYVRKLIFEADPEAVETVKWRKPSNPDGIPVWEHAGLICGGESYKNYVKVTFAEGAKLDDPTGMLDPGNGKTRAALNLGPNDKLDAEAFKTLVREAVEFNVARKS